MQALSKFVATVALTIALATLPGALIAFRMMCDEMTVSVPSFSSPALEADYWARAFGP